MEKIDKLIQMYLQFFNSNVKAEKLNYGYAISVPLLDRHNDCLEFYVDFNKDGTIHLSDDGYTLEELEDYGIKFNRKNTKRNNQLNTILNINNMKITDDLELVKDCTEENFGFEVNSFIQGLLTIGDFYLTDTKGSQDSFFETFETIIEDLSLSYEKNVTLLGKSDTPLNFNYKIYGNDHAIYTKIENNKKDAYSSMFLWEDVSEEDKGDDILLIVIKRGADNAETDESLKKLIKGKGVDVVSFNNKDDLKRKIKAV